MLGSKGGRTSVMLVIACALMVILQVYAEEDDKKIKEVAENWFTKQSTGLLGKKFLEKVKCEKFFAFLESDHPDMLDSNEKRLNAMSICKKQKKIERDRRDLQDYAVKYFHDPEETELSTCKEFAEDFVSEYGKTFKGEKGEAEAYCHFFREEGSLRDLRKVQADHKKKTRNLKDAAKEAQNIFEDQVKSMKEEI